MSSRISIVLPTLNGATMLPALLDSLWSQRTSAQVEVIAVDSGSSDGTVALLEQKGATVINVTPDAFDHGATRNLSIERARGDLVVMLVQDAMPVSQDWLEVLTAPFAGDASIAGTFSRQQARPNASATTRHYLDRWVASSQSGWKAALPGGLAELNALTPMERLHRCAFDNVASCIRRSVWEHFPFAPTPIAEDLEWARTVLLNGWSVVFVPEAVVIHSHDRSAAYEYRRTRLLHARLSDLFGLQTIPSRSALVRAMASTAGLHARLEWRHPSRWPRALALAAAWPAGQFAGARDARLGRVRSARQPGLV